MVENLSREDTDRIMDWFELQGCFVMQEGEKASDYGLGPDPVETDIYEAIADDAEWRVRVYLDQGWRIALVDWP